MRDSDATAIFISTRSSLGGGTERTRQFCLSQRKPHIILWLVDDQGWANAGFHNKHVITPTMDTLAKEGALLDRHYTAPWRTHC